MWAQRNRDAGPDDVTKRVKRLRQKLENMGIDYEMEARTKNMGRVFDELEKERNE